MELQRHLQLPVVFDSFTSLNCEYQLRAKSTALHTKYTAAALLPDSQSMSFPLYDDTAFNAACALGHVRVMMALDNAGARRNIVNSSGMPPLHAAAAYGQAAAVEYLVSKPDADQDLQTPHDLNTALHLACASGCDESVKVLVGLACAS